MQIKKRDSSEVEVAFLNWVVRDLTAKVVFQQRPAGNEGVNHGVI